MHREAVSGSVRYVLPPGDELYTIQPGGPYSPIKWDQQEIDGVTKVCRGY